MTVDWLVVATVAGPIVGAAIGAWVARWAERRPKLVTYFGHVSAFKVKGAQGESTVHTHEVVLRNDGGATARNVRLGHRFLPDFQVHPAVEYQVVELADGAKEIVFPTLVPHEVLTVAYLYFPPILWSHINTYAKSDEGMAQVQTVLLQRQYPRWWTGVSVSFFLIGIITVAYFLIEGVLKLAA